MITDEMKKYTRFVFVKIAGLWNGHFMMSLYNPHGEYVDVEKIESVETINNQCAFRTKNNSVKTVINNMDESYLKNYIKKYKELWK